MTCLILLVKHNLSYLFLLILWDFFLKLNFLPVLGICHAHSVKRFLMSKTYLLLLLCPQGLLFYNRRKLFALDKSMLVTTQFSITFQVTNNLLDRLVQ